MKDHFALPKNSEETKLVEERILKLSSTVITPTEWLNLMAAGESILPRHKGERALPSALDLSRLSSKPQMRLLSAVLRAVGAAETFYSNRRYSIREWAGIVARFSDLSLYILPPTPLAYSVELCKAAMTAKQPMESISLVNALSDVDLRVVHQLISTQRIVDWSATLVGNITHKCELGEEIQDGGDYDQAHLPAVYEEWLINSERLAKAAEKFYRWSGLEEPEHLLELRQLLNTVARPPDLEDEEEIEEDECFSGYSSSYWTLERMFEDL